MTNYMIRKKYRVPLSESIRAYESTKSHNPVDYIKRADLEDWDENDEPIVMDGDLPFIDNGDED